MKILFMLCHTLFIQLCRSTCSGEKLHNLQLALNVQEKEKLSVREIKHVGQQTF